MNYMVNDEILSNSIIANANAESDFFFFKKQFFFKLVFFDLHQHKYILSKCCKLLEVWRTLKITQ